MYILRVRFAKLLSETPLKNVTDSYLCIESTSSKYLAKNNNFFDLGFSYEADNFKEIDEKVDYVMNTFDLVMISDYMEESLVLMASELNWELEDVRFFSVNRNTKTDSQINFELNKKVRHWNKADSVLFDRANKTFWRKVQGNLEN